MLVDNSLRVDPAALTGGAQQFHDTHDALKALLASLHSGEESLRAKWTGGSASKAATIWSDLHDTMSTHVDRLAEDADALQTAADLYRDRDQQEQANIDQQM
ncbi:WXG100 family type VII secretion target [Mycolicibacterium neoaurum]|nr:WXG100 family type VII secretion target [Mycolicibacterium neoaurum]